MLENLIRCIGKYLVPLGLAYNLSGCGGSKEAIGDGGVSLDAVVSQSDGSEKISEGKIAFSSNKDGNYDIYLMNPDGTEQVNITNTDGYVENGAVSWFPFGSRIAFASNRDGNYEIYVMNVDGSNLKNITNNPARDSQPTWSYIPSNLLPAPHDSRGDKIAFVSDREGHNKIYVMNSDGTEIIDFEEINFDPPYFDPGPVQVYDPNWSRDGLALVSISNISSQYQDVKSVPQYMNFSRGKRTEMSIHKMRWPAFSPDSRHIASSFQSDFFSTEDGTHIKGIFIMNCPEPFNVDSYAVCDGIFHNLITDNSTDSHPSWSPDGTKIVFDRRNDESITSPRDIYIININGTELKNLTNTPDVDNYYPSHSP